MPADYLSHMYDRVRWGLVVRGLIALAIGIFIFVRPFASVAAFALVIAIWALITGIEQIVHAFDLRRVAPHWWLYLIGGIISVLFGIAALYYYPALSLAFAIVWVAYWLVLSGFVGIYTAIMERRVSIPWGWTMAWGIVSVIAGFYAIAVPRLTLTVVVYLIAIFAIISGLFQIFEAISLTSAQSRLRQTVAGVQSAARA
jgi:uncharacterized membrane protein HdeD (DUF308 family)